jgi:hypothetical protein
MEIVEALGYFGFSFGATQGWKQQACQDADNGNDDKQLDQSKRGENLAFNLSRCHTHLSA